MRGYVVHRLLALIPTLLFASLIVFITVRMIPGNVIDLMLTQNDISADKLSREQLIHALGFDQSMPEQYLRQFWTSLRSVARYADRVIVMYAGRIVDGARA